jgi:hypothetical protein
MTVDRSRTWRRVTLCAVGCVTLLDAALLERKHGLFTGGFLASHQLATFLDGLAFLLVSALINATIIAPLVLVGLWIGRRLGLRPRASEFAALCTAATPLLIVDFLNYKIWTYLGDAFDSGVMFALAGHRVGEIFAVTAPLMSAPFVLVLIGASVLAAMTAVLHRFDGRAADSPRMPAAATVLRRCSTLVALSSLAVVGVSMNSESMGFGLRWTPSGQLFTTVLNRLSDVDRDGYGLLRNPRDAAPFDAAIHPYAVDIPGNGIDEDGLAGDLPSGTAPYTTPAIPAGEWPHKPPVILFVLESVRADAVGAVFAGRRVTPVMDALAAQGVKVEGAWSHAGSTSQSRYHLLTGGLVDGRGSSTLLDDFKNHDYEVGYFSGQDDDFGTMGLDYQRVDRFYDARQDLNRRYSTSTTPGSLAVPLSVVEERIGEYLASRDRTRSLFLYVNFHDTHYPYHHRAIQPLISRTVLEPGAIGPGRGAELRDMYMNTVANVDQAIGTLIAEVTRVRGRAPSVIVTSDHGESLFDGGFLGHGYALNDAQTRVPFVAQGLPLHLAQPFGQVELRQAIWNALAAPPPADARPDFSQAATAPVFQYLGSVDTPREIGRLEPQGGRTLYDFRADRVQQAGDTAWTRPDQLTEPRSASFLALVRNWEAMMLARARM